MKNLIDILDLSVEEIDELITVANDIMAHPSAYRERCKGKNLATLFYEPSTRTRLSFESAMYGLGGNVLGFSEATNSSVAKGESVADTIRIINGYADIVAMRHPKEGASLVAAKVSSIPIINAGDGGHNHPTQTLTDLLTISRNKGRLSGLTVGLCGDLKFGRTVHSLIAALSRYSNIQFVLISPKELKIPEYVKTDILEKKGMKYWETASLEDAIVNLDILYMTRIQRERFSSQEEYARLKNSYILDPEKLVSARSDLCIMHPLPRVNEISTRVDSDPRACYFTQALCGKYIRMALILKLLEEADGKPEKRFFGGEPKLAGHVCKNPHCITSIEQEIEQEFRLSDPEKSIWRCAYCDNPIEE